MYMRKTIRIPDSVADALSAAAANQGKSVAEYVRDAILSKLLVSATGDAQSGSQKEKEENEKERSKGKVKEEKEEHNNHKTRVRESLFVPPTLEECYAYAGTKPQFGEISVSEFFDYYEAKDWMLGKNKMKDWKAAMRNWVRRNLRRSQSRAREAAQKAAAAKENLRKMAEARKRERLEAAAKPEAWALCAERCANCREGKCSEGAKWPPQLNDWPITPEQCPKFDALASSPLSVGPSKDSSL